MLDLYLVMEYGIQLFMLNVTSEYCVFLVRLMWSFDLWLNLSIAEKNARHILNSNEQNVCFKSLKNNKVYRRC